ncbi:hypothetical protein Glove_16g87 [Diversispora epigaea]|uniref:Uncharacterized protein n=1 Tax=Diversispora epigaea TaxID=1348612 RepID=A0A397JT95_9GLOM|nr:hypothetical protein Glove_16g87 [Diversispora epigaea]
MSIATLQDENRDEIDNKKQTTGTSTRSASNIRKTIRRIAGGKPTRMAMKSTIREATQEPPQEPRRNRQEATRTTAKSTRNHKNHDGIVKKDD